MSKRLFKPQAIGAVVGTFEGVTPGAGGTIAAFMAYSEAKRWSKHPEEFGHGSPEGIAAPECANNVVTATALVPLLSLGIPGSNSAAILLGGFLIHGLQPGPMLFAKAPEVVYGLYGGLFIANIAMLLIGLVILSPCIWLVNRPKPYLIAFILALVMSGVYAIHQSVFEIFLVARHRRLRLRHALAPGCRCCRWCSAWCWASWSNRTTGAAWSFRAAIAMIFLTDKVSLGAAGAGRAADRVHAVARSSSARRRRRRLLPEPCRSPNAWRG